MNKLTAGVVSALKNVIVIVALFWIAVMFVNWGKSHPVQRNELGNKVMGAAVSVVTWTCDQISGALGGSGNNNG